MRVKPLIAIPLIAIALTGCAAQQPTPQQSSAAVEQKPFFSSDEEALAAAQAAYANYLEVSDQIARDGGANPERLIELVTPSQYISESEPLSAMKAQGAKQLGQSSFDSIHLQSVTSNGVVVYLCLDNSDISVVSAAGDAKYPPNPRWPLLVNFELGPSNNLILSGSETWTGTNFC